MQRIHISGFRSLKDIQLDLTPVTVMIGPNGAGKSNLLSVVEMVRLAAHESLQLFVSERGGATYLMHYGPKKTHAIDIYLEFATDGGENAYLARLGYGSDESLLYLVEKAGFRRLGGDWRWTDMQAGHRESRLREHADQDITARTVWWMLRRVNFYHFHDTSRTSPLRTLSYADDGGKYLRSDGSNLPAFLLGLRESEEPAARASWRRILGALQRVAPFIADIVPVADRRGIRLEWLDDQGFTFGPSHLSDGTLRALALIAALAQPDDGLPFLSCIDEPELGLHPAALEVLCDLISSVAARKRVIVATQSPVILDHFESSQIVVAERRNGGTEFGRLEPAALEEWLDEYSLSELYDKNVLGGRP